MEINQSNQNAVYKANSANENQLEQIALETHSLITNYSPHDYLGFYEDSEQHYNEVKSFIASGRLKSLREYFEEIAKNDEFAEEANQTLEELDRYEVQNYPKELAYKIYDYYFAIHKIEDGYDYSVFDSEYNILDGGVYDDETITIYEAIHEVTEMEGKNFPFYEYDGIEEVDFATLAEKTDNVELSKIVSSIKYSDIINELVKSSPNFKDKLLPLYRNSNGDKYVLGFGNLGNGTSVWNYLKESENDYTIVAHIDNMGQVKFYDKDLPETAKNAIKKEANVIISNMKIENSIVNNYLKTPQQHNKFKKKSVRKSLKSISSKRINNEKLPQLKPSQRER